MAKPQELKDRNKGRSTGEELVAKEKNFSGIFSKVNIDNPPEYFNDSAKNYYLFIVKELKKLELINDLDKPLIQNLAFYYSLIEDCHRIISKEGQIIESLHGKKEHPATALLNKHTTKANELAKLLCLTADTRTKLQSISESNEGDKLIAQLLGGF
ncbi:phage terminase small subunit P27 family [Neobacillus sp. MER 74]|uniref:phage terminase small subunit P27 family n=1 Tax=Neobacillus sp. MER 74 TaxID=2939566 RepID=UPI00204142E1|nr:phage terminase small subunit P27 family [Neobacillus sp. MER 74]MCM3115467.1 phage terminase small subunit P27 family [Neobacillus sp. MER 74]